jgi:hypothetical protein
MCKKCNNQSGNIACGFTISCFLISLILMIIHIVYFDDQNPYGELALYTIGIGFILWVIRFNIKTDTKSNTKVCTEF